MLPRSLLYLFLSAVALSCDNAAEPDDLLGTWRLETVAGQALPHVLEQNGSRKVELTGETVTLSDAGRQTMVTSFRVTENGNVFTESIPASGNYTVNGSMLVFTFDTDPEVDTAFVDGDTMTMDDYVYRRD